MRGSLPALACVGLANGLPNSASDGQTVPNTDLTGPLYKLPRQEQNVYIFGRIHICHGPNKGPCWVLQLGIHYETGRSLFISLSRGSAFSIGG